MGVYLTGGLTTVFIKRFCVYTVFEESLRGLESLIIGRGRGLTSYGTQAKSVPGCHTELGVVTDIGDTRQDERSKEDISL